MQQPAASKGMRTFTTIWLGQLASQIGNGLFTFGVGIWVLRQTGSATLFVLITLFDTLPGMLIAPFAGAIVDRIDRRWAMILGNFGASLSSVATVWLIGTSNPNIEWALYPILAFGSIAIMFQIPAYDASIVLLAPKDQLGRVNGMIQTGQAIASIVAPMLAGVLVAVIGIQGVVLLDVLSFFIAITTLLIVRIPRPETAVQEQDEQSSLLKEAAYGWVYIKARQGLLALLLLFLALNFFLSIVVVLGTPLILSFTTEAILGTLLSVGGVGMLIGGLVMARWGGPKRRINGVLGFMFIAGVCVVFYGLRPWVPLVAVASFVFFFCVPIIAASSQGIWQIKVPPEVQGRVFAVRRTIAQLSQPFALIIAGPLADRVFEPLMASAGPLAANVGAIIGVGAGRGIGLLFVLAGVFIALITAGGYLYPRLRLLEDELPDAVSDEIQEEEVERGPADREFATP